MDDFHDREVPLSTRAVAIGKVFLQLMDVRHS
jgi:hypothetical protein